MKPEDLLFYLYAWVVEFSEDQDIDPIDSFMYSVNNELPCLLEKLNNEDIKALKYAFQSIWNSSDVDHPDFT